MNHFSIKDLENLSGIKAHTLRIWEQRFGILVPKRKESNHRYYDNEDLKRILRISYLYHQGHKISKIARFSEVELKTLPLHATPNHLEPQLLLNQLLEASLDFDEVLFEKYFAKAFKLGFEACMLDVIYPFLEKMGLLWLTDHAIPAQEHFASNIIKRKMIAAIDAVPIPPVFWGNQCMVLFTPTGEMHELPLLLMQYLMKKRGERIVFFGNNLKEEALHLFIKKRPVSHLYFHIITYLAQADLNTYLQTLSANFPEQQIVVSGPLTETVTVSLPNVRLLNSLSEMLAFGKGMPYLGNT